MKKGREPMESMDMEEGEDDWKLEKEKKKKKKRELGQDEEREDITNHKTKKKKKKRELEECEEREELVNHKTKDIERRELLGEEEQGELDSYRKKKKKRKLIEAEEEDSISDKNKESSEESSNHRGKKKRKREEEEMEHIRDPVKRQKSENKWKEGENQQKRKKKHEEETQTGMLKEQGTIKRRKRIKKRRKSRKEKQEPNIKTPVEEKREKLLVSHPPKKRKRRREGESNAQYAPQAATDPYSEHTFLAPLPPRAKEGRGEDPEHTFLAPLPPRAKGGGEGDGYSTDFSLDSSLDDFDFSDDLYHSPPHHKGKGKGKGKSKSQASDTMSDILYSDGEHIDIIKERYSTAKMPTAYRNSSAPPVSTKVFDIPGYQKIVKTRPLSEFIFSFPPGAGIPPEEIEEVPDNESHWVKVWDNLDDKCFTLDDVEEEVMGKIHFIQDYFRRLETGHLTPKEIRAGDEHPENFDGPYLPTPRHFEFFKNLNIRVTWPLSPLHQHFLDTCSAPVNKAEQWEKLGLHFSFKHCSQKEDMILARNWFAFQKEYNFYDLRPMLSVRTVRIGTDEKGDLFFQRYCYISRYTKVRFLLYLAQDLPDRAISFIQVRMRHLIPCLLPGKLMRRFPSTTARMLAKLIFLTENFGVNQAIPELILGHRSQNHYISIMKNFVRPRNMKFRSGPWRPEESERLVRGLRECLQVSTLKETVNMKRIPWNKIFPYVRTRNYSSIRSRYVSMLTSEKNESAKDNAMLIVKLIRILYELGSESLTEVDWAEVVRRMGDGVNRLKLQTILRSRYYHSVPHNIRYDFEAGVAYLHRVLVPQYLLRYRGDQHEDDLGDTCQQPDPSNLGDPKQCDTKDAGALDRSHGDPNIHDGPRQSDPDDPVAVDSSRSAHSDSDPDNPSAFDSSLGDSPQSDLDEPAQRNSTPLPGVAKYHDMSDSE